MGKTPLHLSKEKIEDLDAVDREIINLLEEDCRLSYKNIALKSHVSVGTAFSRIKKLENEGKIKGYSVILDSSKLGYPLTAVIFLKAEGNFLLSVEEDIANCSNVVAVYDVTGEFDATVIAKFRDRNDLSSFIKSVAAMPHVKRTFTCVSLDTVKENSMVRLV